MSFVGFVYGYEAKILNYYIYHLANQNIFKSKNCILLQLISIQC